MSVLGRRAALAALGALGALLAGCGAAQSKPQFDHLQTPDERTAIAWIARALRKQGLVAEEGRAIAIDEGTTMMVDVVVQGHPWGVAWLRPDEFHDLEGKLGRPPKSAGSLWVHRGVGDDAAFAVLLLRASEYAYDPDPRGDGVTHSIQESESRTIRDVTDFLHHATGGEFG